MEICVLNGSPKGDISVTMQYVQFLKNKFPEHSFSTVNIGQQIHALEDKEDEWAAMLDSVNKADGIVWAMPVYYALVPAQVKRFIELIGENDAISSFAGKYTTILTTSIKFFDHTCHSYLHGICDDMGMNYVSFFSAHMNDLLKEESRRKLLSYFSDFILSIGEQRPVQREYAPLNLSDFIYMPEATPEALDVGSKKVVILHDGKEGSNQRKMVGQMALCFNKAKVAHIDEAGMKGACTGCCGCAFENECIYDDGYIDFWKEHIGSADILIFAGTINDRYLSSKWKQFLDRNFFTGHVPMFRDKQVAYLVEGPLSQLSTTREVLTERVNMQEGNLAGIVTDESSSSRSLDELIFSLAKKCLYFSDINYTAPGTFPQLGGHKVFRDAIWGSMRAIFKADDRFYKKYGLYDFPQNDLRKRIGVSVFSLFTSLPPVKKDIKKTMKHRMIKPLQKVLEESSK